MTRSGTSQMLDDAVRFNRITLLHGLPRVGRTEVVMEWYDGRSDVQITTVQALHLTDAPVRILDHFGLADVDQFVEWYRANEHKNHNLRVVLVPVNLLTTRKLSDALAGSIKLISLNPLQLSDFFAEHIVTFEAAGPSLDLAPESRPKNLPDFDPDIHWLRGGLPESLTAESDRDSLEWRRQMIGGLLIRDYSSWGITAAMNLQDILKWTANRNCGELDDKDCPFTTMRELRSVLYVFGELGITRKLPNFPAGSDDSLSEMQKLYVRDSGLLHAVLGIETVDQLRGHSAVGDCWESYAVEAMIVAAADRATPQFFRKKNFDDKYDEIDLVLDFRMHNARLVAIECKTSPNAKPEAGFYRGCADIGATDKFVVHSGPETILGGAVDRLNLSTALQRIRQLALPQ